jgi:hypothetical protein
MLNVPGSGHALEILTQWCCCHSGPFRFLLRGHESQWYYSLDESDTTKGGLYRLQLGISTPVGERTLQHISPSFAELPRLSIG